AHGVTSSAGLVDHTRSGIYPFRQVSLCRRVNVPDIGIASAVDRSLAGSKQVRNKNRRQDADDRDHDQQLDEGETTRTVRAHVRLLGSGHPDWYRRLRGRRIVLCRPLLTGPNQLIGEDSQDSYKLVTS